jgi:hypothetical protein
MIKCPATPRGQFNALLSRFPPEIVGLAKRCMAKLRRALRGTNEIVYDYANSVVVSFSISPRGYEALVALAITRGNVRLYFDKSLPDPCRLLKGTGTKVRSVPITSASDIDREEIGGLVRAAIKHSGVTLPRTGATSMIVKSASKTKRSIKQRRSGSRRRRST